MATDGYTRASELHEVAEGEYLRAVGEGATRETLCVGEQVSAAASSFEAAEC